jgi:hypothetical protein
MLVKLLSSAGKKGRRRLKQIGSSLHPSKAPTVATIDMATNMAC